jgi:hypothetical protein
VKELLIIFLLGFLSGGLYGFCKFLARVFKNHIIAQIVFDLLFTLSAGGLFLIVINTYYYGIIRAYICGIFFIGIYAERKTLGKLFAKIYLLLYNWARKTLLGLKNTRLGKIIFK